MQFIDYFFENNIVPRDGQIQAMAALQAYWNDYQYFIIDAPVGVGKTFIALAIAEKLKQSYILTGTKQLQEQYEKDSPKIVNLLGRSNYICTVDTSFNVDAAPCIGNGALANKCKTAGTCTYFAKRDDAIKSQMMITNYSYLLAAGQDSDDAESLWGKRAVIIMDEAHELASHLVNFSETKLNLNLLLSKFDIGSEEWAIEHDSNANFTLMKLVNERITLRLEELNERMANSFPSSSSQGNHSSSVQKISRKLAEKVKSLNGIIRDLGNIKQRLDIFIMTRDSGNWLETPNVDDNEITISPLSASLLFDAYLKHLGEKFVFMSATVGPPEVFAEELGIPLEKICIIKVDTPFDPAKSPITYMPSGKLGYKDIDKSMPNIVNAIETIFDKHKDEKGIIHTGNYKIATGIADGLSQKLGKRLLYRDMYGGEYSNRQSNQKLLDKHKGNHSPTVLLSPSMHTGIDLKGDMSRFQVIVKLPFLSLADPRVKVKADMSSTWYRTQMWLTLMQSTGRSTRSEDDYAVTYILDSSFQWFFNQDAWMLPEWFIARLRHG